MKKNIGILALLLIIIGFSFSTGTAQSKTNLTGTWKMNLAKSQFERQGPSEITIKFEQNESSFTESLTMSGEQGVRATVLKYISDGKESETNFLGKAAQISAKWEGESLIVTLKRPDGGLFIRKLTVSSDGKTMTVIARNVRDDSESTDTILLEKQ